MGESLTCYRCGAQYRGFEEIEIHGGFDLETHERYRQLAARMKNTPAAAKHQRGRLIRNDSSLRHKAAKNVELIARRRKDSKKCEYG